MLIQSFHLPVSSATLGKGRNLAPKSPLWMSSDPRNLLLRHWGVLSSAAPTALIQAEGLAGDGPALVEVFKGHSGRYQRSVLVQICRAVERGLQRSWHRRFVQCSRLRLL